LYAAEKVLNCNVTETHTIEAHANEAPAAATHLHAAWYSQQLDKNADKKEQAAC